MLKLDIETIKNRLKENPGWILEGDFLLKEYICKDFSTALSFVVQVGVEAEKIDHHPDILIHSWNKVKITITSHDAGGITEKDFTLLTKIENIKS